MRKFTLILMLVAFTGFVFAQNATVHHALTQPDQTAVVKQNATKAGGDIFWSFDFTDGLADDWSNIDLSDENMPWIWTTDTIEGCYSPGTVTWPESETNTTGYMAMPADGYNSIPQFTTASNGGTLSPNLINVDAYFQTPILDVCADKPGVILGMWANYRWFTSMLYEVEVSNDYDSTNPGAAHWDAYRVNLEHISAINDPARNEWREINITATAGNQANVVIRWHASGSTHYFWNVDDVVLSEPYPHNMLLNNQWAFYDWFETPPDDHPGHASGYLQHGGYYYMIPKDQASAFVGFQGAIQNFGGNDETNVTMTTTITHHEDSAHDAGNVVYTTTSESKDVGVAVLDTLYGAADFTPQDWGWYDIDMDVSMDEVDGYLDDNSSHLEFIVTDSNYSRTTENITSTVATRNWVGGGYDGDGLGVLFTLTAPVTEVEGMKWYFASRNEDYADYIEQGLFTYVCRIFSYDTETDDWATSPIISSPLGIIDTSQTGTWMYTEFEKDGASEFLEAGDYVIFIETSTGASPDETAVGFYMGEDLTYAQPDVTYMLWLEGSWGWGGGNPSFQMRIAAEDWDPFISTEEIANNEFNNTLSHNYPNPAVDKTNIKYRIDQSANVNLSVYDITGKQVMLVEEGNQNAGLHEVNLDVTNLKAGIYFYTLDAGYFTQTRKMVVAE